MRSRERRKEKKKEILGFNEAKSKPVSSAQTHHIKEANKNRTG